MLSLIFHGVRGSHPVADINMVKYGGNTSCVEIVKTNQKGLKVPVILDSGSGIVKLGYAMAGRIASGEYSKTFTMLFTHLHPDHTEGFNFFVPNFIPFCKVYILGMETLKKTVGIILSEKMRPPTFPIEYRDLKSVRRHIVLNDGRIFYINQEGLPTLNADNALLEIHVMQAFAPSHPQQGAMYYKIIDADDRTSISCIWDIESHPGGDVRVINFARNSDVMIHDTQYTADEYANQKSPVQGFGHSTFTMAMENAEKAQVKHLLSFHYNPRHNDKFLDAIGKQWQGKYPFEFIMSYEGLSLTLDKGTIVKRESLDMGFSK
ncbi:MBL fold metallo-hydrolase [Spirochaetia bacterium]|nr:MBL fold metallo-hydrolase [Spirochaetia bacterium]